MNPRNLLALLFPALCATGCANQAVRDSVRADISKTMDKSTQANVPPPKAVTEALLPPLKVELPKNIGKQMEGRFDLTINSAPAQQVFMGIVSGTPYSMLVHPNVTGNISVRLKDVTLFEALDSIRDLFGYEYRVQGNRIMVEPNSMQTRVFQVNYFSGSREGSSAIRFSGTTLGAQSTGTGQISTGTVRGAAGATTGRDFWNELQESIQAMIGSAEGRSVVVNPRTGNVVVRAMPSELREVAAFLRASQNSAERQVILEAKVIDVSLSDSNQAGVNWGAFKPKSGFTVGDGVSPHANNSSFTDTKTVTETWNGSSTSVTGTRETVDTTNKTINGINISTGSLLGLAYQATNFAVLLSFLETQGKVTVLSSPRIATLNNQKAILKIGTDEYYVTNITAGSTTTSGTSSTTTTPSVTTSPLFSGIALDVTPQIDDNDNVILHIHPSISQVSTITKEATAGSGSIITLPLPSNAISEADSIVRAKDGQVIVIGGLMRTALSDSDSKIPGIGDVPGLGNAFRNRGQAVTKRELVILLKPTVVQGDSTWNQDIRETAERLDNLTAVRNKRETTARE